MTLFLLAGIIVVVVLLVIFAAAGIKIEAGKGESDMIKNVYIYLVLFATLMMTIGGSVSAFMAVADIVSPAPYHQTYQEFKRMNEIKPNDPARENAGEENEVSEEELREQYEETVTAEKERQVGRAKNNLVKSLGWIVIPLPVFIYFQRLLKNRDGEG